MSAGARTPPEGQRPLLVLVARVPEHAQALSIAALALAAGWLAGAIPLPASMLSWVDSPVLAYGWAALLGVSGVTILVAAWIPARRLDILSRITVERIGHLIQSSMLLFWTAAAVTLGRRGAWLAIALAAWAAASALRSVRIGREVRRISRAVRDG